MYHVMANGTVWSRHRNERSAEKHAAKRKREFPHYKFFIVMLRFPMYWTRGTTPGQRYYMDCREAKCEAMEGR